MSEPLAIEDRQPELQWEARTTANGQQQAAYQVRCATSPEQLAEDHADLWDSGRVEGTKPFGIRYDGKPLRPGQRCYWAVRVWDEHGQVSPWSDTACFGQGVGEGRWIGDWIGLDTARDVELPPAPFGDARWIWHDDANSALSRGRMIVGDFELPDDIDIEHAELIFTATGKYSLYWGGERFARRDGKPGSYRDIYYRTMTERFRGGANRLVAFVEPNEEDAPGVICRIVVRDTDGREHVAHSDVTWRSVATRYETLPTEETLGPEWAAMTHIGAAGAAPWGDLRAALNVLPPAVHLRREIALHDKPIRHATLFTTALGVADMYVNGERVNAGMLDPGWTDYRHRVLYRGHDVTAHLRPGQANALGAVLADGWYSGYVGWLHDRDVYGRNPRVLAQLHVEYDDGDAQTFATDDSWCATEDGPTREADMLMGEHYDATRELAGWAEVGFDESAWSVVSAAGCPVKPVVEPHPGPAVVELFDEAHHPRSITEPRPGVWIFDMGQNCAAIPCLRVRGRRGQIIRMRFGERLRKDGTLYTTNLRTARATDTYVCRGDGEETWSPRFTFHGFQYVEVTGLDKPPTARCMTSVPISSDTPIVGSLACSDPSVERLASNIYWSQRSNFIDIPTDCPQRDERMGWTADAQIFAHSAAARADVQGFFRKWLVDLDDAQAPDGLYPWVAPLVVTTPGEAGNFWSSCSPGWSDAGVICPWMLYEIYGDKAALAHHYPNMRRYVEWVRTTSGPGLLPPAEYRCLGDWLNQGADTPNDVIRTAYFAHVADLLARAAAVLEIDDDASEYSVLARDVKVAFRDAYVADDGTIAGDTQTGYALAISFDLLDEHHMRRAGEKLADNLARRGWLSSTGFLGTKALMLALAKVGRNDVAHRLLHNRGFPSWNYSVDNGATSIWERWDGWTTERGFFDPNMNSFNHYALGAVYQWMVENIGGIRPLSAGYEHFVVEPSFGKLTHGDVSVHSPFGPIRSSWRLSNAMVTLKIHVPANTTATVVLPAAAQCDTWFESDTLPPDRLYDVNKKLAVKAPAGTHSFTFEPS